MENFTETEALDKYDELNSFVLQMGELGQPTPEQLAEQIKILESIEQTIVKESLFSENEELEEINEEYLKLLNLPYLQAVLRQRMQVNRLEELRKCKDLYIAFLKFMDHYDIPDKFIIEMMNSYQKDKNFKASRDQKMRLYKLQKLKKEEAGAKTLKYGQGSLKAHEFHRAIFAYNCCQALNEYSMLDMEIEMLQFRNKLNTDPEFKEAYDKEMAKPVEKPFYYRMLPNLCHKHANEDLPGSTQTLTEKHVQNLSYTKKLLTDQNANPNLKFNSNPYLHHMQDPTNPEFQFHEVANPHAIVQTHQESPFAGKYNKLNAKLDVLGKVFQPDHAQPTMTLEELGDMEYRRLMEKQEEQRERDFAKKQEDMRLGADGVEERERQRVADWDNWKDTHEKGVGNKGNL